MTTEQIDEGWGDGRDSDSNWKTIGPVIRIESTCLESDGLEKDDIRTEFSPAAEAIDEWNAMQTTPNDRREVPQEKEG